MKNFNISFVIGDPRHDDSADYMSETEALYDEMYSDEEEPPVKVKKGRKTKQLEESQDAAVPDDLAAFTKMKSLFESLSATERESPVIKKMEEEIKEKEKRFLKKEEQKSKQTKIQNTKKLKTLLRERDVMNDLQYFNEKMSLQEQQHALQQIEEIKKDLINDFCKENNNETTSLSTEVFVEDDDLDKEDIFVN